MHLGFWKRDSADPLLKLFVEKYRLNLLSIPRENSSVGDLYVYDGSQTLSPGGVSGLLVPPFTVPPVTAGERLVDMSGKVSEGVEASAGFDFLAGFLTGFGAGNLVQKLKLGLERDKVQFLRFSFADVTRDSADVVQVANNLTGRHIREDNPLYSERNRYYLVTGVVRTKSVSVIAGGSSTERADVGATVKGLVDASAAVSIDSSEAGTLTFTGRKSLAFGVELQELSFEAGTVKLRPPKKGIKIRGGRKGDLVPFFVGDPSSGSAFI